MNDLIQSSEIPGRSLKKRENSSQLLLPEPSIQLKELAKVLGGNLHTAIFFLAFLRNHLNATKAYMELHPNVDYDSARVLGSRQLAKVNTISLLQAYGLGYEKYFQQLAEGIDADRKLVITKKKKDGTSETFDYSGPDHKTRRFYHRALGEILKIEKTGVVNNLIQNNVGLRPEDLKDEQLDEYIA